LCGFLWGMSTAPTLRIGSIEIPPAEQTPLVLALVEMIRRQASEIQVLRDEIHRLKGTTRRPRIEPSRLLQPEVKPKEGDERRPGSVKRSKTAELAIHREEWLVIDGLPAEVRGHFGATLRQFVLYQVHPLHASQARLLEQLHELGIDISAGQLNEALLPTARAVSGVLHTDDTSARHRGQNAVCTHFGNKLFGFVHGLCWVHAERKVSRLIPLTPKHEQAVEKVRDPIWKLYQRLQAYRAAPSETERGLLAAEFDRLFQPRTGYPAL
jgi:hypothetical protein